MRFLFVKHSLAWPRTSGHDVHGFYMMKALASLGAEVSLATVRAPCAEALDGFRPAALHQLSEEERNGRTPLGLTWLQERYRRYWGIRTEAIASVGSAAEAGRADAVVAVGLDVLPYLAGVGRARRIWYAADEWVHHHVSQMKILDRASWGHLHEAAVKGAYERAYARCVDRAWVVSEQERRAMRWLGGVRVSDVVPNGVDSEYFAPDGGPEMERSAVFWGRLDFGPNIQALEWFCHNVWPLVRSRVPDARFTAIGMNPCTRVQTLGRLAGISLLANLEDLRSEARRGAVVVLPFVSGGGIKNKLLEAASLEKAIVCSPRACGGLRPGAPVITHSTRCPELWAETIVTLWGNADRRRHLGAAARAWVLANHSWQAAARTVLSTAAVDVRRENG